MGGEALIGIVTREWLDMLGRVFVRLQRLRLSPRWDLAKLVRDLVRPTSPDRRV